jgi:hypothetical protein
VSAAKAAEETKLCAVKESLTGLKKRKAESEKNGGLVLALLVDEPLERVAKKKKTG